MLDKISRIINGAINIFDCTHAFFHPQSWHMDPCARIYTTLANITF